MEYFLMRKDEIVTLCDFSEDGYMTDFSRRFRNPELAPLEFRAYENSLQRWWSGRQISLRQGSVDEMLRKRGILGPGQFLLRNLGLSLMDYYWIRPVDSDLTWAEVNLYDNDFRDDLLGPREEPEPGDAGPAEPETQGSRVRHYSPNCSLKGELEKSWIIWDGERILVKGNRGSLSSESINEVIATELHREQGYDNYTPYELVRIPGKPYDYGCCARSFTDQQHEMVSAYALLTSREMPAGTDPYARLIETAAELGADREQLTRDLEYQILTDYLLTNVDRHMENIAFLRNADTLKLERMAPIFDTGRAFAAGEVVPYTEKEISNVRVNSFRSTETGLLRLVTDFSRVDLEQALPAERIAAWYEKDSQVSGRLVDAICRLYRIKLSRLADLQNGSPRAEAWLR